MMYSRMVTLAVVVLSLACAIPSWAVPGDSSPSDRTPGGDWAAEYTKQVERRCLEGISGIMVITVVDDNAKKAGITDAAVRTKVELHLRTAGIKVFDSSTPKSTMPTFKESCLLQAQIDYLHSEAPFVFNIHLSLLQPATLQRKPDVVFLSETLTQYKFGVVADTPKSLNEFDSMLDDFCNRFLAANPKQ